MKIPRIISVDDHVVEPPDLWSARLPAKYQDRGPRIIRERGKMGGPVGMQWVPDSSGNWADIWYYDDLVSPFSRLSAAVGMGDLAFATTTFDEIRPGCWKQKERLADMDANHVDVSICFPNTLPRFCGQTFMEREDKDLGLLCVQAYNDWMIDEWCAGEGRGRLIPLTIVPLWDVELAVQEVHRCAAKGSYAIAFSENPHPLGLPGLPHRRSTYRRRPSRPRQARAQARSQHRQAAQHQRVGSPAEGRRCRASGTWFRPPRLPGRPQNPRREGHPRPLQ